MGVIEFRILNLPPLPGMDIRLMASALLQMPHDTRLVGMEQTDLHNIFLLENPIFKDGTELTANFCRDVAVKGDSHVEVDHFTGLNLNEVLVKEEIEG